jgi:dTDP-4-amino-4,6-dideoxygalactose transaminase
MKIPFINFNRMHQSIKKEIMNSFEQAFDTNAFILGSNVEKFEKEYANFNQTNHAVGVSNGLDALFIALKSLDIKEGDEVIVPANTYIASVFAISYTGATPILVEPAIDTYNVNPENILKAITPKTKAIMPVHLYGQACEMDKIMEIAEKYNLLVIEDNAQAHGSSYDDKLTGSFGNINATSFYPGKNLGAMGDGGCVVTNDLQLAEKAKLLRNYGSSVKYYNQTIGYNMRLDNIQAGFLSIKLKHLKDWNLQRQKIAQSYHNLLSEIQEITLPVIHPKSAHVYHLFVIRTEKRDELQKFLENKGIGTIIHYPIPPHLQEAYKDFGFQKGDFPITELLANTSLSLPMWPGMSHDEILEVCNCVKDFFLKK